MHIDLNNLPMMLENSYKNFHAKGFDYLCLKRTPEHTRKVYFFDGDVSKLSEVISPHDHRYDFVTQVLAGKMSNSLYKEADEGEVYHEFSWDTPLNGGAGFKFVKESKLLEVDRFTYNKGDVYGMKAHEFHTIRMHSDQTVLLLDQFEDVLPIGVPTRTFVSEKKTPDLNGLYEKFTEAELIDKINQVQKLFSKL